jgi:hypothetical protein
MKQCRICAGGTLHRQTLPHRQVVTITHKRQGRPLGIPSCQQPRQIAHGYAQCRDHLICEELRIVGMLAAMASGIGHQ